MRGRQRKEENIDLWALTSFGLYLTPVNFSP